MGKPVLFSYASYGPEGPGFSTREIDPAEDVFPARLYSSGFIRFDWTDKNGETAGVFHNQELASKVKELTIFILTMIMIMEGRKEG